MARRLGVMVLVAAAAAADAGCGEGATSPLAQETALLSVIPQGGATDVDPNEPVVIAFSHAMNPAMAEYAVLHEGGVTGPEVAGTWAFSDDSLQLVFSHDQPLEPATQYTIHLGGGMMDADGNPVDIGEHGADMGGDWCTGEMLGGGMMSGGMGPGMGSHMGDGWQGGPNSDTYGMIFTFTTAG